MDNWDYFKPFFSSLWYTSKQVIALARRALDKLKATEEKDEDGLLVISPSNPAVPLLDSILSFYRNGSSPETMPDAAVEILNEYIELKLHSRLIATFALTWWNHNLDQVKNSKEQVHFYVLENFSFSTLN